MNSIVLRFLGEVVCQVHNQSIVSNLREQRICQGCRENTVCVNFREPRDCTALSSRPHSRGHWVGTGAFPSSSLFPYFATFTGRTGRTGRTGTWAFEAGATGDADLYPHLNPYQ